MQRPIHDVFDQFKQQLPDIDPVETGEWIDSLEDVVEAQGKERARFILYRLLKRARQLQVGLPSLTQTRYINTISPEQEPYFPGDEAMELRVRRMIRWNALAMVLRANTRFEGIGGHLSTYASAASLFEYLARINQAMTLVDPTGVSWAVAIEEFEDRLSPLGGQWLLEWETRIVFVEM